MKRALVFAASFALAAPACAADAPFYQGKTITIVVGFSPGGGFDTYARLLARYLGSHVQGGPAVVVENMPGAGSLAAVRNLDGSAPKDGTQMVTFNQGLILKSLTDPRHVGVDFAAFAWVGSISRDYRVCYAWGATGIKTWDDVKRRPSFVVGTTSKSTSNYVDVALLRDLFRLPVKIVLGYPGSADERIAVERGELDGGCGTWNSLPQNWLVEKKINPFVAFTAARTPDMPTDLPAIGSFVASPVQQTLIDFIGAPNAVAKPYIMSRQVPPERVAILRAAFDATMADPGFLAEARKTDIPVSPVVGSEAQKIVESIATAPPELVAEAAKLLE